VQRASGRLKTFSIVFPEYPKADESRFSRLMARELGSEHQEVEYRSSCLAQIMPKLARHLDEPCSTAPAGVVYQLAAFAAGHVKTTLTGEGADELFGGYEWVRLKTPYLVRKAVPRWPFRLAARWCPYRRLRHVLRILAAPADRTADAEWRRPFSPEEKRLLLKRQYQSDGPDAAPAVISDEVLASCPDDLERRLAFDFTARLSDGILFMTDKVSMAHSLELRMPFLDRRVVDFALRLPSKLKVHRGREKRILGMLARRHLPAEIAARRKRGIGYPISAWNRPPLAGYVRQLLLDCDGPFNRPFLETHLDNWRTRHRSQGPLMAALSLQCWWNEFIKQ
jgi:asparagine synthase (glutamine-hydrolysing)